MANLGRENMAIGKKLIIGEGLKDGERTVCTTNTTCEDPEVLRSNHEEADTRLLLYAKCATQPTPLHTSACCQSKLGHKLCRRVDRGVRWV